MAIVYFDSSALVKLLVEEDGSALTIDLWNGCDIALASRLAYPEVCAALHAARRRRSITARQEEDAQARWDRYWCAIRAVDLTATVTRTAGAKARQHDLSGADAVHLASVLALGTPDVVLATWDGRLSRAATREHLATAPGVLDA